MKKKQPDKTREYSKSTIFVWYENGRRRSLAAQVKSERVFKKIQDACLLCIFKNDRPNERILSQCSQIFVYNFAFFGSNVKDMTFPASCLILSIARMNLTKLSQVAPLTSLYEIVRFSAESWLNSFSVLRGCPSRWLVPVRFYQFPDETGPSSQSASSLVPNFLWPQQHKRVHPAKSLWWKIENQIFTRVVLLDSKSTYRIQLVQVDFYLWNFLCSRLAKENAFALTKGQRSKRQPTHSLRRSSTSTLRWYIVRFLCVPN